MPLRLRSNDAYTSQSTPVYSENKNQVHPTNMDVSATMVPISSDRLKTLEALEASLPNLIQNAILEYKKSNLRRLHEKDKANPENVNKRVKRYAEKHREEINAKRREKRRLQKAAAAGATTTMSSTPSLTVVNPNGNYVPFD
jgi:hypothetical protein